MIRGDDSHRGLPGGTRPPQDRGRDYAKAVDEFVWPEFGGRFNWAFDANARGNDGTALWIVEKDGSEAKFSSDEMAHRSDQVAAFLTAHGVRRGHDQVAGGHISKPPAPACPSTAAISGSAGGPPVTPANPRSGRVGDSPTRKARRSLPAQMVPTTYSTSTTGGYR